MFGTVKRITFVVMLLSGIASVFTTLGTLNNRLHGGFTLDNKGWAIAVGVFAVSAVLMILLKIFGPAFDDRTAMN